MARKKSRSAPAPKPKPIPPPIDPVASASPTATVPETPAVNGTPSVTPSPAATLLKPDTMPAAPQRLWFERAAVRVVKRLGSLQAAVVLLLLFVVAQAVGTIVESFFAARVAQQLVYQTWWFHLLMAGLFVNILFAALKKWPWKKHQTGFLITHLGLLLLIIGGVVNAMSGTDSLLSVASEDFGGMKQQSKFAYDPDRSTISVLWPGKLKEKGQEKLQIDFTPGLITWQSDDRFKRRLNSTFMEALELLAYPRTRSESWSLGYGAYLEITNFYAHARIDGYEAAPAETLDGHRALKIEFFNPRKGSRSNYWIGIPAKLGSKPDRDRRFFRNIGSEREVDRGMTPRAEWLTPTALDDDLLYEFQNPPAHRSMGMAGQLVVYLDGVRYPPRPQNPTEKPVGEEVFAGVSTGRVIPLGNTGWVLRMLGYTPDGEEGDGDVQKAILRAPETPILRFVLTSPEGTPYDLQVTSLFPGEILGLPNELRDRLKVWYNPPDYRRGYPLPSLIQFAVDTKGGLHWRAFQNRKLSQEERAGMAPFLAARAGFDFEKCGTLTKSESAQEIWSEERWEIRLQEWLPQARPAIVPENHRPGSTQPFCRQAIRCRVTYRGESRELIVKKRDYERGDPEDFQEARFSDGERILVAVGPRLHELPFSVKLLRAEQTTDPGTGSAASYSSFVQLFDKDNTSLGEHYITMNEPLHHDGLKLFQTNLSLHRINPLTLEPISSSTFTVSADPGLWLKYLGSILLALGIATMFYMKAYTRDQVVGFFRRQVGMA